MITISHINQLLWLLTESMILGAILYLLLRLRPWLGNTPLVLTVGSIQFLQVLLALSLYIEVLPGLWISPGSSILFTGTILSVLLVYIVDDAKGARRFIYSLLAANIILSLITFSASQHLLNDATQLMINLPIETFQQNPRVLIVGTVTLFFDTILIIILYEYLTRIRSLFLRMTTALYGVLIFDSLMFITGSFYENENYMSMLYASIIGKLIMAPPATMAVAVLHHYLKNAGNKNTNNIGDFFSLLTYRQKYELAKNDSLVDPMTRLYNRRAFDKAFAGWTDIGTYAILMVDADNFKQVNDELGHDTGDRVIKLIAAAITTQLRGSDVAYRFGGEEFVVFLPYTKSADAIKIGNRIRQSLSKQISQKPLPDGRQVTLSIGVGVAPNDGKYGAEIIKQADQRLYWAKNNGKDQVAGSMG